MKGKGIKGMRSYAKGDQYVTIVVDTPKALNDEQRELFEKLAQSLGTGSGKAGADNKASESGKKEKSSFFDKMKDLFNDDDDDNSEK